HTLVTNDGSKGIRAWNVATHTPIADFQTDRSDGSDHFASAAMSLDGSVVATGSYDGKVRFWDVNTGKQIGDPLTGPAEPVLSVAFSPDRRILATGGSHGNVQLWNIATHTPIGDPLPGFTGEKVMSATFSPDGSTLAAAAELGMGYLWDVASHAQVGAPLIPHYAESIGSVAFSPDSHTLATSTDTDGAAVRLWDVPPTTRVDSILCTKVGRSLTPDEWQRYVPDLPYRQICP
ncbi:MAG: WD40 repeat domain-containing protein, partial [Sciscionella sp.]